MFSIKANGSQVTMTCSDVHLPRLRFLDALSAQAGIDWAEVRSRQVSGIGDADLFYWHSVDSRRPTPRSLRFFSRG